MLVFYGIGMVGLGVILPLFVRELVTQLLLVTFMATTLQKQWTAESVAGERENRTLESLLSSPLPARTILLGKALFNLLCAAVYTLAITACVVFTRFATRTPAQLTPVGWVVYGAAVLCVLTITALYGVLCSARAETVRQAGKRPTIVCYLFSILQVVVLTVLTMGEIPVEASALICSVFFLAAGSVIAYTWIRILRMTRPGMIEVAKQRGAARQEGRRTQGKEATGRRSPISSVFAHEWRYLKTLKGLLLQFFALTLCPAGIYLTMWLMTGQEDLNYTVLLTILMMPRIPVNLIAYSVGGEKAYRTGESILSTPVSVSALFWGKAAVPVIISALILLLSSALSLALANVISLVLSPEQIGAFSAYGSANKLMLYNGTQLVLLFGVGMATSLVMIFASAMLSLKAKTPRKGLYYSTFLGLIFFLPASGIVYLAGGSLWWSLAYFILLLVAGVCLYAKIHKASRPALMASL
ncbi:ABC transporter permease subunit [Ruminococcaceae bacterium OttesenSCG-928-A11]|nr:ABC transporter permease subunit [Ruminococcaceae bacterium OttesenSCG-928-A11]